MFLENAKIESKTYIKTIHNDIYVNNNSVWAFSSNDSDQIFSLKSSLNVYNEFIKSNIELLPLMLYYISKNGIIKLDDNMVLPNYLMQSKNSHQNMINLKPNELFVESSDLIPDYRYSSLRNTDTDNGFYFDFKTGTRFLNSEAYLNLGFTPTYKYNNFIISAKLDFYFDENQEMFKRNWLDKNSLLEKINLQYKYSDYKNSIRIDGGNINEVSFAHGYLVNKISNSFDYPFNNFGININYKLDNDFMEFHFLIPSIRDYFRNGGVLGMHSSLFLSHKFPLTLGFGIVTDMHQFSQVRHVYVFPNDYSFGFNNRQVTGLEFDFNFSLIKKIDLDISLFGEFVGIWYPESVYYVLYDNSNNVANDLRYRKGVWGIKSPGIHINFNNRLDLKFSYNHNSALFIPSYFDSNYLMNRARYYTGALNFPLVNQQINMLNEYSYDLDKFIVPKDLYPVLFQNKGFSPYQVKGLTAELNYNIRNYLNLNVL